MSLWLADEVGTNGRSKREITTVLKAILPFSTPKPERLLHRILHIASNPTATSLSMVPRLRHHGGGRTKMGRRYIGIGGRACRHHYAPRLDKVIAGERGGISNVGWQGGGGSPLLPARAPVFDRTRIAPDIRFAVLAAHIWFSEAATPWTATSGTPLLGFHDRRAFALLYNGILGDKRPDGSNVLTRATRR